MRSGQSVAIVVGLALAAQGAVAQVAAPRKWTEEERRRLRRSPVVDVFEQCKDAVVNISTTQIVEVRSPFGVDGLFEDLFDFPAFPGGSRRYKTTAVGSGFVVHSSGYVVTNAHVVARTAERKVIFADKSEYDAEIVAADARRDLAVLKIDCDRPLKRIDLGSSDDLMVGETVVAIGNPLGLETTVTAGVVSALNRKLESRGEVALEGLIQTDASINPGNSGGPLLNVLGELVGVTTAIRGDAQNIGFAIPVDQLVGALPELLDVERRYRIVAGLDVSPFRDAAVRRVAAGGPAARAGVQVGDRLLSVNGKPLVGGFDYYIELLGRRAGEAVELLLERNGRSFRSEFALAALPKPDAARLTSEKLGLLLEPMTAALARKLGLAASRGFVVRRVEPGGPAAKAGVEAGDVVVGVGPYSPTSLDDVGLLLEEVKAGDVVPLRTLRFGRSILYQFRFDVEAR
jgi:serine protease Do